MARKPLLGAINLNNLRTYLLIRRSACIAAQIQWSQFPFLATHNQKVHAAVDGSDKSQCRLTLEQCKPLIPGAFFLDWEFNTGGSSYVFYSQTVN